jgi:hypothetical protein
MSGLFLSSVWLRYLESSLKIANRSVRWKVISCEQNLVLEMLQFKSMASETKVIVVVVST